MEDDLDCRKEEMKESKKRKLSRTLINKMKLTKVKKRTKLKEEKKASKKRNFTSEVSS